MELRDLKDVITKVPTVTRETSLRQLLDLMVKEHADALPVLEKDEIIGVVNEKDLLRIVRAQPVAGMPAMLIKDMPKHIEGRCVAEIMTHSVITASLGDRTEDIIKKMAANNIRTLFVVEGGKLIGVARARDILRKYYSFR